MITLPIWILPALFTVLLWAWAVSRMRLQSGFIAGFAEVLAALVGTLVTWLCFFVVLYLLK